MRHVLPLVLLAQGLAPASARCVKRDNSTLQASYDYIIVGGGASGLTVASRLTEDAGTTVLVIEAGDLDKGEDIVTVPGLAGGAIGTKYDWNISYAAQPSIGNREVAIPLGKIVGGSTKLNRMVFDRGSKSDYDRWAALGNQGWDWDSLLPYFKKNEIFTPAPAAIAAEYNITHDASAHGTDGLMHVTYAPFFWPTTKNMVAAAGELGIATSPDQANGNAIGGYFCPHNQDPKTATRSSAREAYYDPFVSRPNLHLVTGQMATRILTSVSGTKVSATGIEFAASANGPRSTVAANKEVIMAAGALHTPQLLQVSGIGDQALLSSINVKTVVNLPAVGQNFHDHVLLTVVNSISQPMVSAILTSNATFADAAMAQYKKSADGPYADPTGDYLAFLPLSTFTNQTASISSQATAQNTSAFLPAGVPAEVAQGYAAQHKLLAQKLTASDSAILEVLWADGAIVLGLEAPFSRGSVKAGSASVFDAPVASPAYLSNPVDTAVLVEGVKFARTLAKTQAISSLSPVELVPGANITSDAAIADWIKSTAATLYHPAGSCKMGAREQGGVVDDRLKVYGVEGLRIVDASVMPLLPASHTMTTVYAVAERAADIIRGKC